MHLLASIMPGIRELRVPLASGLIWLAVITLGFFPYRNRLMAYQFIQDANAIASALPVGYTLATLSFAAYLIGVLAFLVIQQFDQSTRRLVRSVRRERRRFKNRRAQRRPAKTRTANAMRAKLAHKFEHMLQRLDYRLRELFSPVDFDSQSLMYQSIENSISKIGVPYAIANVFEKQSLLEQQLPLASAGLARRAGQLYEHWTRNESEADFRLAISWPVLIGAILAASRSSWWLIIAALMLFTALFIDSYRHRRRAAQILATALYAGETQLPIFDILGELPNRPSGKADERDWANWLVLNLERLGGAGDYSAIEDLKKRYDLAESLPG